MNRLPLLAKYQLEGPYLPLPDSDVPLSDYSAEQLERYGRLRALGEHTSVILCETPSGVLLDRAPFIRVIIDNYRTRPTEFEQADQQA